MIHGCGVYSWPDGRSYQGQSLGGGLGSSFIRTKRSLYIIFIVIFKLYVLFR